MQQVCLNEGHIQASMAQLQFTSLLRLTAAFCALLSCKGPFTHVWLQPSCIHLCSCQLKTTGYSLVILHAAGVAEPAVYKFCCIC